MDNLIKGKINITFDKYSIEPQMFFMSGDTKNEYIIMLIISPKDNLKDILKLTTNLINIINEEINIDISMIDEFPDNEYLINILNLILQRKIDILSTITEIKFTDEYDYELILDYLKRNKEIKDKEITLGDNICLNDTDKIKRIGELFKEYLHIQVLLEGNSHGTNLSDSIKTINMIDSIVERVKKYNFSPIEQIMYVYDIIRSKVYNEEKEEDSYTVSRDLSQVLLGNKIVCSGYANIFDKILKKLNISTIECNLDGIGKKDGHTRNAVYIKDNKYNINGVYFFDLTWDSKKDDDKYLLSYLYFAKTIRYFDIIDTKNYLVNKTFPLSNSESILNFIKVVREKEYKEVSPKHIKTINNLSILIDNGEIELPYLPNISFMREKISKEVNLDLDKVALNLIKYIMLINNPIDVSKMLLILYNVRKVEYYENPDKFPFDISAFYLTTVNSLWILFQNNLSMDEYYNKIKEELQKYNKELELTKHIEEIKLTKTLRKIYDSKIK